MDIPVVGQGRSRHRNFWPSTTLRLCWSLAQETLLIGTLPRAHGAYAHSAAEIGKRCIRVQYRVFMISDYASWQTRLYMREAAS